MVAVSVDDGWGEIGQFFGGPPPAGLTVFYLPDGYRQETLKGVGLYRFGDVLFKPVFIQGVLAYQVLQRRREIGIRLALGSDGARIFRLVVREGLALLGVGLGAGFAGAFAIRRAMQSQLYGVQPLDPLVLATVTVVLGMVAFIACAVPAIRAAHIDPVIALSEQ